MDLFMVLQLLCGLALFLFGMNSMGDGLESLSGGKLEKTLEKMTNSTMKGFILGAAVTAFPWSFNLRPQRPLWLSAL